MRLCNVQSAADLPAAKLALSSSGSRKQSLVARVSSVASSLEAEGMCFIKVLSSELAAATQLPRAEQPQAPAGVRQSPTQLTLPAQEPRGKQEEVVGLPDLSQGRDVMPEAVLWILFGISRHQEEGRTEGVLLLSTHTR